MRNTLPFKEQVRKALVDHEYANDEVKRFISILEICKHFGWTYAEADNLKPEVIQKIQDYISCLDLMEIESVQTEPEPVREPPTTQLTLDDLEAQPEAPKEEPVQQEIDPEQMKSAIQAQLRMIDQGGWSHPLVSDKARMIKNISNSLYMVPTLPKELDYIVGLLGENGMDFICFCWDLMLQHKSQRTTIYNN